MILRKLFGSGFNGDLLIAGAISKNATLKTSNDVSNWIQRGIDGKALDVDRDGQTTVLGDGIMIMRYLQNQGTGNLIDKAISYSSPYYGLNNANQIVADNIYHFLSDSGI